MVNVFTHDLCLFFCEKIGIKIFSVLNNFGLFKSLKPITVNFLANRMIQEVLSTNNNILIYKLEDILIH